MKSCHLMFILERRGLTNRNVAMAIGLAFFTLLGCSSKDSNSNNAGGSQLTRPAALSMLQSNIKNLGWQPATCRVPLRLNATVYKTTTPQELQEIMARLTQQRTFYQDLVGAGVVKEESYKTSDGIGSVQTYHNYYYSLISQSDISMAEDDRAQWAVFVLDKLSIDEVTGISQNGPDAEIVAKMSHPLTRAANTLNKLSSKYDDRWGFTDCFSLIKGMSQTPTEARSFQAKKFDDGWRIQ